MPVSEESPFLNIDPSEYVASNKLAFALYDGFAVSPGHTLVVPRRLVATWWEASQDEQRAILALVDEVRLLLDKQYKPDGYNVGFNAGQAAGQTVSHLHVHVIPRYLGDMEDPRGGVRHVIPEKGNYLAAPDAPKDAEPSAELFDQANERLLIDLRAGLRDPEFDRVDLAVAFVRKSGLDLIQSELMDRLEMPSRVRILTTDYMGITEPSALRRLMDLTGRDDYDLEVRLFQDPATSFHAKAYIFWSTQDGGSNRLIVGSSNLTRMALTEGVEWNLSSEAPDDVLDRFDLIWNDPRSKPLDHQLVYEYENRYQASLIPPHFEDGATEDIPQPREIQREALKALEESRQTGFEAGMVVMATGLGKTWLAAFDSLRPEYERVLFIAHREEILRQSQDVFRQVAPDADLGLYYGRESSEDAQIVFASVQTLQRNLDQFDPASFDYIVVDEFHHAAARSYRKVINHFKPRFLLGLTATPDRTDGADLLALCGDNVVFDCNLFEGIERKQLSPFHYWGVADSVDFAPIPWRSGKFSTEELEQAVATEERSARVYEEWKRHGGVRTLAFCVSKRHADFMSKYFNERGVRSASVHSGENSYPRREALDDLRQGGLNVIFSVDLFNEGVSVSEVDTVLMLRPTSSPIVFLQQLGRGLRTASGKSHLDVVDFIGNHRSFLSVPRFLFDLGAGRTPSNREVLEAIRVQDFSLPEGCTVNYELDAIELLEELGTRVDSTSRLVEYCRSYIDEEGVRPSAFQVYTAGLDIRKIRPKHGSWFGFLNDQELLDSDQKEVFEHFTETLKGFETEPANGPHKFVTVRALIQEGALTTGLPIPQVAEKAREIMSKDPRLVATMNRGKFLDPTEAEPSVWETYWRQWPIDRITDDTQARKPLFRVEEDALRPNYKVEPASAEAFEDMATELIDFRLAPFLKELAKPAIES